MKKSTQWIVISTLSLALIILAVNLLLYRQLRMGHATTISQEQAARRTHHRMSTVHYLVLSGTLWVNILPAADSNVVEAPMDQVSEGTKIPDLLGVDIPNPNAGDVTYTQRGDTLYVKGINEIPLHRPFTDWAYRRAVPQTNVFAPDLRRISVVDGQVLVKGHPAAVGGQSLELTARGSTVWLGEMYDEPASESGRRKFPDEYFDSVVIHAANSILLLNRPAIIAHLRASIDSASEINDRGASVEKPYVTASADSRVSFTGVNFSKAKIITE